MTVAVCPFPVTVTVALLELVLVFGLQTIVKAPLLDPDGLVSDSQLAVSVAVQVTLLVTETIWLPPEAFGFQVVGDTLKLEEVPVMVKL